MPNREVKIPKIPDTLTNVVMPMPVIHQFDAMQIRWALSPMIICDQETMVICMANRPAEELFGYNLGELVGVSVHDLVPDSLRERHREHVMAFAAEAHRTARPMGQGLVVRGRDRAGHEMPVNVSLYRFSHNQRRYVMAELSDMRTGGHHYELESPYATKDDVKKTVDSALQQLADKNTFG